MMPILLFLCLIGLSCLPLVSCQDCLAQKTFPVYANISDNATFNIQMNESQRFFDLEILRSSGNTRRRIFIYHIGDWRHFIPMPYDLQYHDRIEMSVDLNATDGLRGLNLTVMGIQLNDNGTFIIQSRRHPSNITCFIVHVLGRPVVSTSVSPTAIEEGNSGHLMCLTTSTTVPASHDLTMFVSWYIGGQLIETTGRYMVDNNKLHIYSMSRADDGLVIDCKAMEDKGLTTWANMSIIMNWGPYSGLILQPSETFYHIEAGKAINGINCSADCKPECEISWTKAGKGSVVSPNGLLFLGQVTDENSGEYMCTASRHGSYKNESKSIFILKQEHVSQAMAGVGVGLSAAALLLVVGIVFLLFRQKLCFLTCHRVTGGPKENTASDQTSQNRTYEDLKGTRSVQETYDALALGTFEDSSTRDQESKNADLYENNRLST